MKESKVLEYKETVTNTFLKTVSAFANYGTGEIKFGITDSGKSVGVKDTKAACLDIENKINDSISPKPGYTLSVNSLNVITLTVYEGLNKPYLYKSKAYVRNDTSTTEVDAIELRRLLLEGQHKSFENLPAKRQNLTFDILEQKLKEQISIDALDKNVLKTLELISDNESYNIAAEILADKNDFPGIDIIRFGDSIDIIFDREICEKVSCLAQFDTACEIYKKYYRYEKIDGMLRKEQEIIPEKAFREAVVNALVHRTWDVNANIRISMFKDKIEIVSPGGLPHGITKEEYLKGKLSILRNPIIGNVFFRLHLIERFGTGVRRINEAYAESESKPVFELLNNSISVILPVFEEHIKLTGNEKTIYTYLKGNVMLSSSEIAEGCGFGKTKTVSILKELVNRGYIKSTGTGRSLKYICE
ncbi:MAG: putative DNA binding domain-containing protein [Clostridia bacterium]|nr:putative DNA binding domain-containing protein [Clostridia bacterium]